MRFKVLRAPSFQMGLVKWLLLLLPKITELVRQVWAGKQDRLRD